MDLQEAAQRKAIEKNAGVRAHSSDCIGVARRMIELEMSLRCACALTVLSRDVGNLCMAGVEVSPLTTFLPPCASTKTNTIGRLSTRTMSAALRQV